MGITLEAIHICQAIPEAALISPHFNSYVLVTLMRLRLNLCGQDLGYRFKMHASTIRRTFEFVIGLLYAKLKPLIIRPTRDALKKTMPMVFHKHLCGDNRLLRDICGSSN